jgi:hypothetical protein
MHDRIQRMDRIDIEEAIRAMTDMNAYPSFGTYYANNVYTASYTMKPPNTKMEKVIEWIKRNNEVEGDKIQSVHFITGQDDVYTFRIQYLFTKQRLDISRDFVDNVILVD